MTIVINNRYKNRSDIYRKFLIYFWVSVYTDKIIGVKFGMSSEWRYCGLRLPAGLPAVGMAGRDC
jgi:hypothetical protein